MNLADSERMAGVLEAVGYECAADPSQADVLIYNTCSIREKAEVKVYSALGKQVRCARQAMQRRMVALCRAGSHHLRAQGIRMLYDEPRRGTAGSQINFAHPKDCGGVLVELVEPAPGH
jgi:tRNA A37 methylthiotransferase MiaB